MLRIRGSNGFDAMSRSLQRLADNARALEGKHSVSAGELFNASFMRSYTRYGSFDEFKKESPVEISADAAWVPPSEFERFVSDKTNFASWGEMLKRAVGDWAKPRLLAGVT